MKLIAVNIHKGLSKKVCPFNATKRAWKLNESKFRKKFPDFVIGVASGEIKGFYRLVDVSTDSEPKRVKFNLKDCDDPEKANIISFINGRNLRYFVIKQKW